MTKYYPAPKLLRSVLYHDYKKENSLAKQNSLHLKQKKKVGSEHCAELLSIFSTPDTGTVWNDGETNTPEFSESEQG